ncbi:unnamed protein product, partial [Closterium sp. Naga37s-1]
MPLLFFIPLASSSLARSLRRGAHEGNPPLPLGGEDGSAVGDDGGGSNALVIAPAAPCARGSRYHEPCERVDGVEAELASGADVAADVALDNDELELVDDRKKRRNSKRVQRKLRRIQAARGVGHRTASHGTQQHIGT